MKVLRCLRQLSLEDFTLSLSTYGHCMACTLREEKFPILYATELGEYVCEICTHNGDIQVDHKMTFIVLSIIDSVDSLSRDGPDMS